MNRRSRSFICDAFRFYTFIRCICFTILIASIVIFLIILNRWSYSTQPACDLENISQVQLFKSYAFTSNTFRAVDNPSNDNQFFTFFNESPLVRAYIDVVRDTVCGLTLLTRERSVDGNDTHIHPLNIEKRVEGLDWPLIGITMIGQKRLVHIEWALRYVIAKNVTGDFIECGVWRGGASIFATAVLKALNIRDRHVWLADSFQGLPKARTAKDDDKWFKMEYLKVSEEEVRTNFRAFNLLDDHVHFCKGYFVDSLPRCNVSQIAVLRLDGDMYESTMDQLFNLYSKLQLNGIIILDDYAVPECNKAVHDFRRWHNITETIMLIPGTPIGRYWIKKKNVVIRMNLYTPLISEEKNIFKKA